MNDSKEQPAKAAHQAEDNVYDAEIWANWIAESQIDPDAPMKIVADADRAAATQDDSPPARA